MHDDLGLVLRDQHVFFDRIDTLLSHCFFAPIDVQR